jgi:hypothetical protein
VLIIAQMWDKVYVEFACADLHQSRGEDRSRFSRIEKCYQAHQAGRGTCNPPLQEVIDPNQNDPDQNCPEGRGETPPETP